MKQNIGKVQLDKNYDPKSAEGAIYKRWMENGYFHAVPDPDKKPYTIVMPPPNITGHLHMGHAIDNTLQDILIRFKRMQGFSALWLPGTDHASIATEAKITEAMAKEGITKESIGREKFLERAWEWKKEYGDKIVLQLMKLGSSCDWDRLRFTMDEGLSGAVQEVFINLYKKGLIYRGERITNRCCKCKTSISDAEIEHNEVQGKFVYVNYPLEDGSGHLMIATTRPETIPGDTAVAVNPEDERYKDVIGKNVLLPLMNRKIPVIADEYVDKDFGTGCVKITPAHDPNDFIIGERHGLPLIIVIDGDGNMNADAGDYAGLDKFDARERICSDLKKLGLLVKDEPYTHNVGTCYRCGTTVEPMVSKQWFVKMEPLAKPAVKAVRNKETTFVPERFSKIYFNWMENIQDWCISRQLWWGHRIPAYYCQNCSHIEVAGKMPDICPQCSHDTFKQDPDTLDTWFSSALWPFSTLGWPDKTEDLAYYYPTDVLVTGYDIIFFWVARMIFSGLENMGTTPFKHVFIHGLVRDEEGRKMSKSSGNGIDPLEVINEYGADALRYALTTGNAPGNDQRYLPIKVEAARNFTNKIWNASRFVLLNFDNDTSFDDVDFRKLELPDKWILTRLNELIREVTLNIDNFDLGVALQKIYDFIRDNFCDWYIELVKPGLYNPYSENKTEIRFVLNYVLCSALKLLHPFMPFLTEEIYGCLLHDDESIMTAKWPEFRSEYQFIDETASMETIMQAIKLIRNMRGERNVHPSIKSKLFFVTKDEKLKKTVADGVDYFTRLGFASDVIVTDNLSDIPANTVSLVMPNVEMKIPLDELINSEEEKERLNKEKLYLESELKRVEGKLNNTGFIEKAPPSLVEKEREKQQKFTDMYDKVLGLLSELE